MCALEPLSTPRLISRQTVVSCPSQAALCSGVWLANDLGLSAEQKSDRGLRGSYMGDALNRHSTLNLELHTYKSTEIQDTPIQTAPKVIPPYNDIPPKITFLFLKSHKEFWESDTVS